MRLTRSRSSLGRRAILPLRMREAEPRRWSVSGCSMGVVSMVAAGRSTMDNGCSADGGLLRRMVISGAGVVMMFIWILRLRLRVGLRLRIGRLVTIGYYGFL